MKHIVLLLLGSLLIINVLSSMAFASDHQIQANKIEQTGISHLKHFKNDIYVGGQPSEKEINALKAAGVVNIINLRVKGEFSQFDESEVAGNLGLNYSALEIAGASGLTLENAKLFDGLLNKLEGPTYIHCASGNRVGALFAVKAAKIDGKSVEEALEIGDKAGMTRLKPKVEALLKE